MGKFLAICMLTALGCCFLEINGMPQKYNMYSVYQRDLPPDVKFEGSVAVDTETMGLQVKRDRLCLVQLCSQDGKVYLVQIQKEQRRAENLERLLTDPTILKIFHFARFDVSILNYTFGVEVGPIYCTKIASKLVRTYNDKHGLQDLCKEILGFDLSKQQQSSDWGKEELSPEQLKYAAGDVLYLHKIKAALDEMLIREGKMPLAQKCFETVKTFADLQLAGIDPDTLFTH
ncbi:MAG: ribonuclease H-like domain-containing protein [Holosporaceae bacterium]|nr:ribonuclease H-like domain-containing protein [Holosporaceae bacterium]